MKHFWLKLLLVVALIFVSQGAVTPTKAAGSTGSALIRVAHHAEELPAVDVYLDDATFPVFVNLATNYFTIYTEIAAGEHNVVLRKAGSDPKSDPLGVEEGVKFGKGASVTIMVVGAFGDQPADILYFSTTRELPAGKSRLQMVNGMADKAALDVSIDGDKLEGALKVGGIGNIALEPGKYKISFAVEGTSDPIIEYKDLEIKPGMVYTIYATGTAEKSAPFLMQASSEAGFLRVFQGSADTPKLDIYVNDIAFHEFSALSYRDVSNFIQLPAGSYTIDVREYGKSADSKPFASLKGVEVKSGTSLLLATFGAYEGTGDDVFRIGAFPIIRSALNGKMRVMAINLNAEVGAISFFEKKTAIEPLSNIGFGKYVSLEPIDPLKTTLGVGAAGDKEAALTFEDYALESDYIYTLVLVGTSAEPRFLIVKSRTDISDAEK